MNLELVGFKICPYVQRSLITLHHKGIPHTLTFIDPSNLPEWFLAVSPTGQVPMLKVDETSILFESGVINEFLDEISPPALHPADPLLRGKNRAWSEYASRCLQAMSQVTAAKDEGAFQEKRDALWQLLDRLEREIVGTPFFNGKALALVDTAYAPLFMRLSFLHTIAPLLPADRFPKISRWSDALSDLESVQKSAVEDFFRLFMGRIGKQGGFLAT